MKEVDDTPPPKDAPTNAQLWELAKSQQRTLEHLKPLVVLPDRIRELEAKLEELHATDSARRLNLASSDPEWY
jgi:hypothetical protein